MLMQRVFCVGMLVAILIYLKPLDLFFSSTKSDAREIIGLVKTHRAELEAAIDANVTKCEERYASSDVPPLAGEWRAFGVKAAFDFPRRNANGSKITETEVKKRMPKETLKKFEEYKLKFPQMSSTQSAAFNGYFESTEAAAEKIITCLMREALVTYRSRGT
jgi:hypothetical protein